MKNTVFKTLAIALSILMALHAIPAAAFEELANINASFSETETEQSTASKSVDTTTETKEEHIYEDTNLREANTKHFRLDDGSYVAAQYPYAVHIKDDTGTWQDIDNALADSGSDYATSNARIKFAKKTTGNETLFTLHDGNYKITLSLNGANKKVNGIVTNNSDSESDTKLQKMMYLEKLSSSIRYNEILDGVDLEYVVDSLNIKENIIVKEKQDSYSYSFALKLNNLSATLNDDGSINIYDPNDSETIYVIPSPVVYDASGEFADNNSAHYTLVDQGNGNYTLTVIADTEWMNASERAWPITIDPAVYVNLYNDMSDTFISTTSQTTTYGSSTHMNAGHGPVGQEYIAYWMADTLPTIPTHAYITSAQLELHLREFKTELEINEILLGIYPVTSSWTSSQTWEKFAAGTYGQISSNILECVTVSTSDVAKYVSFDITPLVCQWFDGTQTNYGVAIRQVGEDWAFARFDSTNKKTDMPCLTINYRTQTGIESYWTYASHSAGGAGSGNVNVATGELTFVLPTLSTIDGLFGYTPSLVYNGSKATQYNVYNASTNPNCPYLYPSAGYGWRLSVNETVVSRNRTNKAGATETYYVWTDGDGTEHAFYVDGSVYKDEDGLLMTLTANSTYITIEDSSHNVRHFKICTESSYIKAGAILEKITDKFGNSLVFLFDNSSNIQSNTITYGKVTKIGIKPYNSTFIPYLTLTYNGTGCITQISSVTGHKVNFTYSSTYNGTAGSSTDGFLRKAAFSRVSGSTTTTYISAEYDYNNAKHLVFAEDTVGGTGIRYGITSSKITMLREQGSSIGQTAALTYGNGTTYIRTSGSDDSYGTSDDIYTHYTFDRAGRTISSYSANQDGSIIYGASMGEYDNEATNKIKTSAVSGGSPVNYIVNSNFEMSSTALSYWNKTTNVSKSVSIDTFESHAAINVKASTTDKIYQYVKLPNGTYTLSANITTENCKDVTLYIKATPISSGTTFSKEIPASENAIDSEISPNLTFEVNSDSGYVNYCISIEAVGGANVKSGAYVTVDDIMLEKGIGSSQNSVVRLGSFYPSSITSSGATYHSPTSAWARSNTTTITIGAMSEMQGHSAKITGSLTQKQYLSQTINILPASFWEENNLTPITDPANFYMFSGFAKGTHQVSNGFFGFKITATCYATSEYDMESEYEFEFPCNDSVVETQFVSGLISIPNGEYVKTIKIQCVYDNNPGTAYFDNISLVPITDGSAAEYSYYDKKVQIVKTPESETVYAYNENGDLALEANNKGNLTKYTYKTDADNNLTSVLLSVGSGTFDYTRNPTILEDVLLGYYSENVNLTTTYTYNTYGLVTQVSTYSPNATANRVITSSTYDTTAGSRNFGKVLSETDANGSVTEFVYDSTTGNLLYQVAPDGTSGLYYTYDSIGRLTEVVPLTHSSSLDQYYAVYGEEIVEYLYNAKQQLSGIETDTTAYTFTYDDFGNTTEIKAGDYILATYTYNSYNGKLSSMTYGNETTVSYTYDALDRIEKILYNGTVRYEYQYTSDGKLHSVTDATNNTGYLYDYDSEDRLLGFVEYKLNEQTNVLGVKYKYNEKNQVSQVSTSLDYSHSGSNRKTVTWHEFYFYNEENDLLEQFVIDSDAVHTTYTPSSITIDYQYDDIQRASGRIYTIDGYSLFTNTVTLTYNDKNNGKRLSSQVKEYSTQIGTGTATTYTYSYDSNGNITQIIDSTLGAEYPIRYYYDDLGQLTREDNPYTNTTYVYTYDNGGNRLSKTTYAYTTATSPTGATATQTYTYDTESGWGDRLTAFNGTAITYDAIGNPLSYNNGNQYSFTWKDGRRLATATKGGVNYSFTYNDEGIRTSKTVGSVKHTNILDGSRIVSEQWGNYYVVYLYDESGAPIGMQYRLNGYAAGVFDTFYFEKNLQGDIIAVYNASGLKVVGYTYDAWGNCTTTYYNSGSSTGAQYNPFRYRGYYYDADLGLYYLNNRYYDSRTGRFINSDSVLNGGVGLTSYNSFAYCSNNPIKYSDPLGYFAKDHKMTTLAPGTPWADDRYILTMPSSKMGWMVYKIKQDYANFDINNTDIDAVYTSFYISAYKGKLVIKLPIGKDAFSCGIMVIGDKVRYRSDADETINHEFGHTQQFEELGFLGYMSQVGISSITAYNLSKKGVLSYNYFSSPWESQADAYGNVTRKPGSKRNWTQSDGYYNLWDLFNSLIY